MNAPQPYCLFIVSFRLAAMAHHRDVSPLQRGACVQIYVFSDKGSEATSDLSVVTSHIIEQAVAEVLINLAAEVRAGYDTGCSSDAFAEVQVRRRCLTRLHQMNCHRPVAVSAGLSPVSVQGCQRSDEVGQNPCVSLWESIP